MRPSPRRAISYGGRLPIDSPRNSTLPAVSGNAPEISLKVVLLPAPLGPIRPRISPGRISNDRSLTATRPPNCLRTPCTSSSTWSRGGACAPAAAAVGHRRRRAAWAGSARATATGPRARTAAAGRSGCRRRRVRSCRRARAVRQHVLQHLLQQRDQRGADHRAPDAAGAADDRHEQVLDALVDAEGRRVDEALQMRIQPAGNAGEQRRIDEDDDLQPRRRRRRRPRPCPARPSATRIARPGRESSRLFVAHSAASAMAQIRK